MAFWAMFHGFGFFVLLVFGGLGVEIPGPVICDDH